MVTALLSCAVEIAVMSLVLAAIVLLLSWLAGALEDE